MASGALRASRTPSKARRGGRRPPWISGQSGVWSSELQPAAALDTAEVRLTAEASSGLRTPDLILLFDRSDWPVQFQILVQSGVWSLELQPAAASDPAEVRLTTEASSGLRAPDSGLDSAVRQVPDSGLDPAVRQVPDSGLDSDREPYRASIWRSSMRSMTSRNAAIRAAASSASLS